MGFDAPVPPGGYAWWYVDGLSADGRCGLTIIAFIGSVFSPYYAWARRRGGGDPTNHCAVNVALYGPGRNRWAMTERGRRSLARDARSLAIGPSSFEWDGAGLTIRIAERTMPWAARLSGTVRVHPGAVSSRLFTLDAAGRHRWRPVAPCATVEVDLDEPGLRWSGPAYVDLNAGDEPLEAAFHRWTWSRGMTPAGASVLYDVRRRDGTDHGLALAIDRTGAVHDVEPLPQVPLPRTAWRLDRTTRADPGHRPTVVRTLEDAPFYSRSVLASRVRGEPVMAMHESLSLDRFKAPVVQAMLPFRMPRVG